MEGGEGACVLKSTVIRVRLKLPREVVKEVQKAMRRTKALEEQVGEEREEEVRVPGEEEREAEGKEEMEGEEVGEDDGRPPERELQGVAPPSGLKTTSLSTSALLEKNSCNQFLPSSAGEPQMLIDVKIEEGEAVSDADLELENIEICEKNSGEHNPDVSDKKTKRKSKEMETSHEPPCKGPAGNRRPHRCSTCNECSPNHSALGDQQVTHKKRKHCLGEASAATGDVESGGPPGTERHQIVVPQAVVLKQSPTTEFLCNKCGIVFPTGQALGGHKRKHWKGHDSPVKEEKGAESEEGKGEELVGEDGARSPSNGTTTAGDRMMCFLFGKSHPDQESRGVTPPPGAKITPPSSALPGKKDCNRSLPSSSKLDSSASSWSATWNREEMGAVISLLSLANGYAVDVAEGQMLFDVRTEEAECIFIGGRHPHRTEADLGSENMETCEGSHEHKHGVSNNKGKRKIQEPETSQQLSYTEINRKKKKHCLEEVSTAIVLKEPTTAEYPCDKCGMVFPNGQALGGHKRKHWTAHGSSTAAPPKDHLKRLPQPAAALQSHHQLRRHDRSSTAPSQENAQQPEPEKTKKARPTLRDFDLNLLPKEQEDTWEF